MQTSQTSPPVRIVRYRRSRMEWLRAGLRKASWTTWLGLAVILLTTLITGVIVGALAVAVNVYGFNLDVFPQMIPD